MPYPTKKLGDDEVADNPVNILHRYFIWANKMRTHFDETLEKHSNQQNNEHQFGIESMIYMSLWYGLLYVVIEGWKSLKLGDATIDELLRSPNTDLLKCYRNASFHYPKKRKYHDERFENFFKESTTVEWVRKLNSEFGRYFFNTLKNDKRKYD